VVAGWGLSLLMFRRELLETMVASGYEVSALAPQLEEASVVRALKGMGVRPLSFRMQRKGTRPDADIRTCIDLVQLMKMVKPDKVLLYTLKPVIYGSLAAMAAGVPETYSLITGLGYSFIDSSAQQRVLQAFLVLMYRVALRGNRAVLFQNPDDLALFQQMRIVSKAQRTQIINGSGVNLSWFSFQPVTAEQPTFLLMSRFLEAKGIREYSEAAATLKRRYPQAHFQLLGMADDGPGSISADQLRGWKEGGMLEVLDYAEDVRPFLNASTVVVLPSYREGTPRSVLEALAVGRAVITTDVPGCRETVVEGKNGFLVRPRDVASLAAAMERFIINPALARTMGTASRELAESKYDVHNVNDVILKTMRLS
jgi:glycosyltransferase involved in cell wall biosynthesis